MFGARRVARRTARRTARRVSRRRMLMTPPPPPPAPAGAPPPPPPVNYVLLAGEGSSPPVKLTEQDAHRIQEDTGLPPEQLEDNDLHESMQELNIHSQPLTPQDQAALGLPQTPVPASTAQPASTTVVHHPPPATPQPSIEQQLQSLSDMKNKGLISAEDYEAKKKQILGL